MDEAPACVVLVLAAGGSARMGGPKQLLDVGGQPLLRRAALTAIEAGLGAVFVVLGAQAERIRPSIADLDVRIVDNADWRAGIASSLRAGVAAIERELPATAGVVVMPADQPRLSAAQLQGIDAERRASGATIVASDYGDHRGPPAYFGRRHFPALVALRGDVGARELLRSPGTRSVAAPPGSGFDLDRPGDLGRLRDG